jgi:hypothetical protein
MLDVDGIPDQGILFRHLSTLAARAGLTLELAIL